MASSEQLTRFSEALQKLKGINRERLFRDSLGEESLSLSPVPQILEEIINEM